MTMTLTKDQWLFVFKLAEIIGEHEAFLRSCTGYSECDIAMDDLKNDLVFALEKLYPDDFNGLHFRAACANEMRKHQAITRAEREEFKRVSDELGSG
jgi:hypothetical protein